MQVFVQVTARNLNSSYLSALQYHASPLPNGQKNSMTEDSWADDVADGHLLRLALKSDAEMVLVF